MAVRNVWATAIRTQRKRVYFFKLAQMGCVGWGWLLALAPAARLCKRCVASPRTCVDCHAFLPDWLLPKSYRPLSSGLPVVLGEALGMAMSFCPECPFVHFSVDLPYQQEGLASSAEGLCSTGPG